MIVDAQPTVFFVDCVSLFRYKEGSCLSRGFSAFTDKTAY